MPEAQNLIDQIQDGSRNEDQDAYEVGNVKERKTETGTNRPAARLSYPQTWHHPVQMSSRCALALKLKSSRLVLVDLQAVDS